MPGLQMDDQHSQERQVGIFCRLLCRSGYRAHRTSLPLTVKIRLSGFQERRNIGF